MADNTWIGTTTDWHTPGNWSLGTVPVFGDNVIIDGSQGVGGTMIWATTPIECDDFTIAATATESNLFDQGGVIAGDFSMAAGYFAPTGGGGYTMDFQGNWLKTGGSFSVGTGVGVDPTCKFSGIGKTYNLNDTAGASYQNLSVTGEYVFSGTKLSVAQVSQKLSVTGELTINANGTTICNVTLEGVNAGFDVFTGILKGTGRFWYHYREGSIVPSTGTIAIRYFRFDLHSGQVSGSIDEDLVVDGWNNVHNDWGHQGTEPWIHDDDGDVNYITLPSVAGSVGKYDEHYTEEDIDSDDWTSIVLSKIKVHLKGRLYDGTGGHAFLVSVRAYLWDGVTWQDGGTALFLTTAYADRVCSTSLHGSFTTISKLDGMLLKLEIDQIINGGADKGGINITQSWVEVEGTAYWNPVFELAPRIWGSPCEVEIEYTDTDQTFRLEVGDHTFYKLTIRGDNAGILVAEFDCDTNTAQMWCEGKFDIYKDAFPGATFTLKLGNGTHVFRGSIDFYFSYASAVTQLVVDAAEGTMILWPKGRQVIPAP